MKVQFCSRMAKIIPAFVVMFACSANSLVLADYWQDQQIRNQVNQNTSGDSSGNQYYNGQLNSIQNNSSLSPADKYSQELHVQQETNDRMEEHQAWERMNNDSNSSSSSDSSDEDDSVPSYHDILPNSGISPQVIPEVVSPPAPVAETFLYHVNAGDIVTATFSGGVSVGVSYTVKQGDSSAAVIDGLVAAINADTTLANAGIKADNAGSFSRPGAYVGVSYPIDTLPGLKMVLSKTAGNAQATPVVTSFDSSTVVGQHGASSSVVASPNSAAPADSQAAPQDVDAQSDDKPPSLLKRIFHHMRHPLGDEDD